MLLKLGIVVVWLAATAVDLTNQTIAISLFFATALAAVSPLLLKRIPLDGKTMAMVSFVEAVVIALLAGVIDGQLVLDTASFQALVNSLLVPLLATSGWLWTVQQLVYHVLSDQPPKSPLAVK